jgi:hypothetical protein
MIDRPASRGASVLFVILAMLVPSFASAEEETPFHLSYEAPAACPDRSAFLAAVRARTARARLVSEHEPAISFTAIVESTGSDAVGHLEVREPEPDSAAVQRRSLSSRTCVEVVKALALVVALLLDPDARTGDPAPLDEPAPPPPPALPKRLEDKPSPRPTPHSEALAAGAEVGMVGGIGPALAPVVGAFVDLELERTGATMLRFEPSFRLGADFGTTSSDLPAGAQRYWWLAGALRVCPLRLVPVEGLRLAPCGGIQVGAHHGSTREVPNPTSSADLWVAPTFGASFDWRLSQTVSLELWGGGAAPLIRTRFFLAPNTTIFEVPAVSGGGGIALRARFW